MQRLLELLNLELQTHPFSVLRAAALTKWVCTGGYGAIVAGGYPRRADDDNTRFGDDIAAAHVITRTASISPLTSGIR